jgi:hypothetical protein
MVTGSLVLEFDLYLGTLLLLNFAFPENIPPLLEGLT